MKPRYRFGGPQPREGENHVLTNDQVKLLEFIHLYGGLLTTEIIFEWAKTVGLYKNIKSFRTALMHLHHHFELIDRPAFQRRVEKPLTKQVVHRLSEKGEGWLRLKGMFSEHAPRPYGALQHQMIAGCTYACTYIECLKRGIPFTPQHELGSISIQTSTGKLVPDNAFIIHFPERPILFFREIDKGTEPGHSTNTKRKTWGKNIDQYDEVIYSGDAFNKLYKTRFNLPANCGAVVQAILVPDITTKVNTEVKVERILREKYTDKCNYFTYHTTWEFGYDFSPPKFIPMLDIEWKRFGAKPMKWV